MQKTIFMKVLMKIIETIRNLNKKQRYPKCNGSDIWHSLNGNKYYCTECDEKELLREV